MGFYGLKEIIEEYISNCPIFAQSSGTLHKLESVKYIDILGPNIRYEFDLSYFKNDLAESFGIKMLLSTIDAFNRKVMIIFPKNEKKRIIL